MLHKPTKLFYALLFAIFTLLSQIAFAADTAVNGVAARSETLQAFTGVADDPSTIYYNPAGLTQVKGTQVQGNILGFLPEIRYKNSNNGVSSKTTLGAFGGSLFVSTDHFKKFVLGFGIYSPFARATSLTKNLAVLNASQRSKIIRVDFVPTIAFNVNKYLSLGIGLVLSKIHANTNILGLRERGDGYGVTGQIGALVKLPHRIRIGLNYRAPENAKVNGRGYLPGLPSDGFDTHIRFPGTVSAGVSWQASQHWLLAFSYDYEMWSYVNKSKRNYSNPAYQAVGTNRIDGRNSSNYRFGVEYRPWHHDSFRAGYSYVGEAIPGVNILPSRPDFDVNVYSVGWSHYWKQFQFDVGYEYYDSEDRKTNSAVFPGDYRGRISEFLAGVTYKFA